MIFEIEIGGRSQRVEVEPSSDGLVVRAPDGDLLVRLRPLAGSEWWRLDAGGRSVSVRLRERGAELLVTLGAARTAVGIRRALPVRSRRTGAAGGDLPIEVRAPMPGLVVDVPVAAGAVVAQGAAVAIVEAMKMQMEVPAPAAGRVEEIRVRPGQEVAGGQVLVVIRP